GFLVKTLIIGDPGQLPPINGEGAFTDRDPDVFLRQIHRQAENSPIIRLSTLARQGLPLPKGFSEGSVRVLPLNKETQPLIYREETQPICGLNRVRHEYNKRIRRLRGFDGEVPQVGERVICCRNNSEEGIFNGGLGKILKITDRHSKIAGAYLMDVEMEDLEKPCIDLSVDPYLFKQNFTPVKLESMKLPRG